MPDERPAVQLTEHSGEWTLRIKSSPELLERLAEGKSVEVTVSIRPNLVPGEEFRADATLVR